MAIGRVSGPMLLSNLERQGYDLQVDNGLLYFDVNQRRVGVNTATPNATLHVEGNVYVTGQSTFQANVNVNAAVRANKITQKTPTGTDLYSLPTVAPTEGKFLGYSAGGTKTAWVTPTLTPVVRRTYHYEIDVNIGATYQYIMDLQAVAAIVYQLTVSHPCTIEVHGLPDYSENNPYTFIATANHLTDDGSVYYSDGTVIQQRQYNIFANLEAVPKEQFYVRLTNITHNGVLSIDLMYFAAVTNNATPMTVYRDMQIVTGLPVTGYQGQMIYDRDTDDAYVYVDTGWKRIHVY